MSNTPKQLRTAPLQATSTGVGPTSTSARLTYDKLSSIQVKDASTGTTMPLTQAWSPRKGKLTIVAFLTHFADFNSWEYAQKLRHFFPSIDDAGAEVVAVGIGSLEAAREFASLTSFPLSSLYVDETAAAYKAMGFSTGFEPPVKVNPYVRLGTMLTGIGSPGTIKEVLRGYIGDKNENTEWIGSTLDIVERNKFDVLGATGARPFELATMRLQNMVQILKRWPELSPSDKELITQLGGTLVFDGSDVVYEYKDKGILVYTDIQEVLRVVGASK